MKLPNVLGKLSNSPAMSGDKRVSPSILTPSHLYQQLSPLIPTIEADEPAGGRVLNFAFLPSNSGAATLGAFGGMYFLSRRIFGLSREALWFLHGNYRDWLVGSREVAVESLYQKAVVGPLMWAAPALKPPALASLDGYFCRRSLCMG